MSGIFMAAEKTQNSKIGWMALVLRDEAWGSMDRWEQV